MSILSGIQFPAVLAAILPVAAPFLVALYKLLVGKLPAAVQSNLQGVISSAVSAAEQVYQDVPGSGQAKKQFVVSRIEAIFGKKVNASLVEVLLEEVVSALPKKSGVQDTGAASPSRI